jgi:hypothetical protein
VDEQSCSTIPRNTRKVIVDNVTDSLSSVPENVVHEHVRQLPNQEWIPDPLILDEQFLVVNVRNSRREEQRAELEAAGISYYVLPEAEKQVDFIRS